MGVSLVHWNIRGARANASWLYHSFFSSSDIIALQETFLGPSVDFTLPGKIIYRQDRSNRPGGGLLTAVRRNLSSHLFHLPLPPSGNEALGVEIRFSPSFTLQVVNIYSPPNEINGPWLDHLVNLCKPPFIIVGDFNAYHSSWGGQRDSPQGAIVMDWLLHNNICLVNSLTPTHISPGGRCTLLDLSVASPDLYVDTSYQVHSDTFDSDHFPVKLTLNSRGLVPTSDSIRYRYDWGAVATHLNKSIQDLTSLDDFHNICSNSLAANSRRIRIRDRTGAPWWDSRCSYLLGQKRKHLRLAKRLLCSYHWGQYKHFSALLKREIKDAKRSYWADSCKSAAKSGSIFKILRALQNRKIPPPTSHNYISIPHQNQQTETEEARTLARTFTRFSVDIYIPLDFSVNDDWSIKKPFDLSELRRSLSKSPQRTPGKDGIPLRLLQCLKDDSLQKLLDCFNNMWSSCVLPDSWRSSIVVPILKPGKDACLPTSYRPIALTSVVSKVFERMLLNRIVPWILKENPFHPNHFGFIPFRDCTPALMRLFYDLYSARQQRLYSVLVSLDITSAYDSVWPDGLALKMLSAGVDGHFTKWIHTFMQRNVQVRWKGVLSDPLTSYTGVPQGAVLSPLLFSLYMRDIFEAFDSSVQGIVYADDIFVYHSGPVLDEVITEIQKTLHNIARWCEYWKLFLNPSKCSSIVFSRKYASPDVHLRLSGEEIPWVTSLRVLGLTFERGLIWGSHVSHLREKAIRKLNVLKSVAHVSRGISTNVLLRLSRATVVNALHHGSAVYSFACRSTRSKLEPIQNAALRIALGLPRWTPIPILRREARALSVASSHDLQRKRFLIRHVSLGAQSPISFALHPNNADTSFLATQVRDILDCIQVHNEDILRWSLPEPTPSGFLQIHTNSFDFQNKSLHAEHIVHLFNEYLTTCEGWQLIATDASKTNLSTCIAYWDLTHRSGLSSQIHDLNSIFTAEALALGLALDRGPQTGKLILFSDSRAVVSSLGSIDFRSPRVITYIYNKIIKSSNRLTAIQVVWVPGHTGIYGNEMADTLARTHGRPTSAITLVSPEDICRSLGVLHQTDDSTDWVRSKYCNVFPHLTKKSWEHRKLNLPRRGEVLLTRLRTRTLPTLALLHRFSLSSSPLCPFCKIPETSDHFLLDCGRYASERSDLYRALGISGTTPSFSDLCDLAVAGASQARRLVSFLLKTDRF